ncbi:MAG: transposase [Alphaproteobacteria bacterium]|nr:transposase [Alphaproteobacteria bacterium]
MIKQGVIVDATVIESRSSRPRGGDVTVTDPEAGWDKKQGTFHHGYKRHACVDTDHVLIQGVEVTFTDVHESLSLWRTPA